MIDEAFLPLEEIIARMISFRGEFVNDEAGVRSYITRYEIEAPVEMDVTRDDDGTVMIGSTPPIYYVETAMRPVFHQIRFTADLVRKDDA